MTILRTRFYREQKHWSQAELAHAIGVSEAEIKAYEGGFESPTLAKAVAMADALGVTVYDLAKGAVRQG